MQRKAPRLSCARIRSPAKPECRKTGRFTVDSSSALTRHAPLRLHGVLLQSAFARMRSTVSHFLTSQRHRRHRNSPFWPGQHVLPSLPQCPKRCPAAEANIGRTNSAAYFLGEKAEARREFHRYPRRQSIKHPARRSRTLRPPPSGARPISGRFSSGQPAIPSHPSFSQIKI